MEIFASDRRIETTMNKKTPDLIRRKEVILDSEIHRKKFFDFDYTCRGNFVIDVMHHADKTAIC